MAELQAKFVISNTKQHHCPKPTIPEYAFIGRSNVGKSSLINMLTNRKNLAKTSGTPGKTKLINHFIIDDSWYLVDLPGYGYAKVSKTERTKWDKFIKKYLETRENLMCVFVLIDIRILPQKIDMEFMEYLGNNEISFTMIFTKADKLTKTVLAKNLTNYKAKMLEIWEEMPKHFVTSAESKLGKEETIEFIRNTNQLFVRV